MENLTIVNRASIKRIYDLKGSTFKRKTKNIEKINNLKTLKDLDFLWMKQVDPEVIFQLNKNKMIKFSEDQIDIITQNLIYDLKLLRELYVMDYSLLLIIIKFPEKDDSNYESVINLFGDPRSYHRIFKANNGKYIYIMGIIDYLQKFDIKKFLENKYKGIFYKKEIETISAVDPFIYSYRFLNFLQNNLLVFNDKKENNKLNNP